MSPFHKPVRQYMSSPVRTIREDAPLARAYEALREHWFSSLAVVDAGGRLAGLISRTDLLHLGRGGAAHVRRAPLLTLPDQTVGSVMMRDVVRVGPDAAVRDAAAVMVSRHIHRVFVEEGDALVGVFSTRDVMSALGDAKLRTPVSDYMSVPVLTVRETDTLSLATDKLEDAHISGLVVVDDADWPVGVFTQVEALQARDFPASTPVEAAMSYALLCLPLGTSMFRAAAQASATRVRRVIVVDHRKVVGMLTGIDFARAVATTMPGAPAR